MVPRRLYLAPMLLAAVSFATGAESIPRPTPEQAAWQDLELGLFIHFDISIFTGGGEGDWQSQGNLDPSLYNPAKLDTNQWLEAAKALGARYAVFVAKHCTGFISWQSDAYPYGVRQSKWRDGTGDVVRDFVASCKKYGVKPGIYCSMTANAYCRVFNNCLVEGISGPNDPRQVEYRRRAEALVTELWGNYGPLAYIWFDGGALPPEQGGPDIAPIARRLQPQAVAFQGPVGIPAGNTRWPGNESGVTAYPTWSTVKELNKDGPGDPAGTVWQPPECDAPLRNHDWFWHPGAEHKIRSLEELVEMYYGSVGTNANLILNANIDRDGLVPEPDMRRFREFGDEIRRRFGKSIAETSGAGSEIELALARPTAVDHVMLMEEIAEGERIRSFTIEGNAAGRWVELSRGRAVGHKRIERFDPVEVSRLRLRVTAAIAPPLIRRFAAYQVEKSPPRAIEGRWSFDEEGDTLHGAVRVPGRSGKALRFDGATSFASLGNLGFGAKDFTIAAWIKPHGALRPHRIVCAKERSGVGRNQFRLYLGAGNRLGFALSGAGGAGDGIWWETAEGAVPNEAWSRVAVVRRGTEIALFVGGKAIDRRSSAAVAHHRNALDFRLGARYGPSGDGPDSVFEGAIDDFAVWARALAPEELTADAR